MRVPAPPSRIEFAGHRIVGVRLADCLDVDQSNELSARLFGSARMRRLRAGGAFHFTHDHVPFGAISFDRMSWGAHTSLVPKAEALPGYYLVTLPIRGAARVRQDSHVQPLARGTCGVFGPLRSFEIEAYEGFDQLWCASTRRSLPAHGRGFPASRSPHPSTSSPPRRIRPYSRPIGCRW